MIPEPLIVICDACRKPIADQDGYLHVSHADIVALQGARAEYDRAQVGRNGVADLTALMALPAEARWEAHHIGCDPNDRADYSIAVDTVRTWPDLIRRTTHLLGKTWFSSTDWDHLLDEAVNNKGTRVTRGPEIKTRIADRDIALVRERNPIAGVIAARVLLTTTSPGSFTGTCPFCQMDSFTVSSARGYFRCTHCETSGDVIDYIRKVNGFDFNEAVKYLARSAGVELHFEAVI